MSFSISAALSVSRAKALMGYLLCLQARVASTRHPDELKSLKARLHSR